MRSFPASVRFSFVALWTILVSSTLAFGADVWLPASADKLPRWRGFNLLEKFNVGNRKPFVEDDFRLINKLGFNFVRLPMDYRCWIKNGDWKVFDEEQLKEIDQAVAYGEKYHIHVCLNFHRAPGYTVAKPPEKTSLWTDAETQEVCAAHWATFAKRYRGIPNERLSFNLMNEPAGVDAAKYATVVRKLVTAIRAADPQRLIISDGLQWGQLPIPELADLKIAQATRGYAPGEISHYQANWVNSSHFPTPRWPRPIPPNGTLLSPNKPEGSQPLVINAPFATATELRIKVHKVSSAAKLVAEADGQEIWAHGFKCGPGDGEWKKVEYSAQYKIYQNIYDLDFTTTIPAHTKQVQLRVTAGDWLDLSELGFKPEKGTEDVLELKAEFGKKPAVFQYSPGAEQGPFIGLPRHDRDWLWKTCIEPWHALEVKGVGVMVGEWGAYNKTPHDVTLRWAEDHLANWQKANCGWALWNFRGPFGILDSGRADVKYEEFAGHKLDRKFLDLLQRY